MYMRERDSVRVRDRGGSRRREDSALVSVVDSLSELSEINQMAMASMVEGVGRMMMGMAESMGGTRDIPGERSSRRRRSKRRHKSDCGCDDCYDDGCCGRDMCHCKCCIGDVDLVIYTRIGERRVVPLMLENPRRREKEITMELSSWTTRNGQPANINAQIVGATSFTLEACSEEMRLLRIDVVGEVDEDGNDSTANLPRQRDVAECEVVYADLRVTGCEMRPLRIALAILPYSCSAFEIECGCSCC